jgi:hypothetical protein
MSVYVFALTHSHMCLLSTHTLRIFQATHTHTHTHTHIHTHNTHTHTGTRARQATWDSLGHLKVQGSGRDFFKFFFMFTRALVQAVGHLLKVQGSGRDFLPGNLEAVRQVASVRQVQTHDALYSSHAYNISVNISPKCTPCGRSRPPNSTPCGRCRPSMRSIAKHTIFSQY